MKQILNELEKETDSSTITVGNFNMGKFPYRQKIDKKIEYLNNMKQTLNTTPNNIIHILL